MSTEPQISITKNTSHGREPCGTQDTLTITKHLLRNGLTDQLYEEAKKQIAKEKEKEIERKKIEDAEEANRRIEMQKPKNVLMRCWYGAKIMEGRLKNPYLTEVEKSLQGISNNELIDLYQEFASIRVPPSWDENHRQSLLAYLTVRIQQSTAPENHPSLKEKLFNLLR